MISAVDCISLERLDCFRAHNLSETSIQQEDTTTTTTTTDITTPMRTLVCFGQPNGHGEIEISPPENLVSRESQPTAYYHEKRPGGRTRSRPKEEIRLFHTQPLMVQDDVDVLDDGEEELCFESTDTSSDDEPLFPESDPAFLEPVTTPPRLSNRRQSQQVLAAIDHMEQALDSKIIKNQKKNKKTSKTRRVSKKGLKMILSRLSPSRTTTASGNKASKKKEVHEKEHVSTTPVKHNKRNSFSTSTDSSTGTTSTGTYEASPVSAWDRLFPSNHSRPKPINKSGGDKTLLIPKDASYSFLAETDPTSDNDAAILDQARKPDVITAPTTEKKRRFSLKKKIKTRGFLQRRLARGRNPLKNPLKEEGLVANKSYVLGPDKTRSLSMEDTDEDLLELQPGHTFKSDEELVDHLVKVCDRNSSLEKGFNCLQEKIRERSFSRSRSVTNEPSPPTSKDGSPIFSTSFLDMSFLSKSSSTSGDPHNDSIPSFSSLEEFLTSVNDSAHSASLEALLFEQELEKLSTEELAELLDAELEKLIQEGLA